MDPHKFSVLELFVKPERYVIPLYQRRYIWSEGRQWQPLWEDISGKVEEVREKGHDQVRPHFLGAIVVAKRQTSGNDLDIYDVVDGQQRLTTFQIFLLAFRDQVKALDKSVFQRIRAHTRNGNEELEVQEHEQYKVWPTRFDQPLFTEIWGHAEPERLVAEIHSELDQRRPVGNIKGAYAFFSKQLKDWLAQDERHAADLLNTLKRHLQVVRIDLQPGDDPQVIFETLNARGEPLQAADLIRNFIFQDAEQQQLNAGKLFQEYWADFDEDRSFWRESVSRGRTRRDQLTWFLTYFLTVQHGREISEGNIFDEFKAWWRETKIPTVEERLIELRRYAAAYLKFHQADVDTRLGILRVRLEALDTTTLTPILLLLLTEGIAAEDLDATLLNLESYLIRRYVAGLTSKNNNQRFLLLLNRLKRWREGDGSASCASLVRAFLSEGEGDSVRWPSDEEFRKHLLHDPTYKKLKPRGVVMLLEAAEVRLHSDKQEILRFGGTSSVEHVMPRRWEKNWQPPAAEAGFDASQLIDRRNVLLHNLGNLTLVTQKLNTSMSNNNYVIKRPAITRQTLRMLNHYFQTKETWNEAEIKQRAKTLAEMLVQTWPAPEQRVSQSHESRGQAVGVANAVITDAEKQFDRWLEDSTGFFQVEEIEVEGGQGVQFIHRSWSRSWKLLAYRQEEDGEENIVFDIRNDFGSNDSFYDRSRAVFSRLQEPLALSFGEELVESDKGYLILLDPDTTARELQIVFDRICTIFIPEVEKEITVAQSVESTSPLNDVMQLAWPHLPEGFTFLARDLWAQSAQRRIAHAAWPTSIFLTYKIIQRTDGSFTLGLHDEVGTASPFRNDIQRVWPELTRIIKEQFAGRVESSDGSVNSFLNVAVPRGTPPEQLVADLERLIAETRPLIEKALGKWSG